MATVSLAAALFVGFLPFAIGKFRERRAAKPNQVVASPGGTPGQACRASDSTSARLIADTRQIASAPDSAWTAMRAELEIPRVDSNLVVLVREDGICRSVLSAFNSTLPATWPTHPPTSLYVAKVGTVYVGMIPALTGQGVDVYTVTDARFDILSKFAK
jgi:hypothetical protein